MLAFQVTVSLPTKDAEDTVATWLANPDFANVINSRMWNGDIVLVSFSGGYPDTYRVYGPMVVRWLKEMDPELQLHPLNQITMNEEFMDKVGGRWLRMTIWDQS